MLLSEILSEIKLDTVDYFEVSQVERDDEKTWQVIVWAEPPTAYNIAALFADIDNCPKEIKKYLKKVSAVEKTEDDSEELTVETNVVAQDDEGVMLMYSTLDFDSDEALHNSKMVLDTYIKHTKAKTPEAEK